MGERTRADRDAVTVEIGYALFSAAFAAAVVFGVIAGPKLMFAMPYAVERGLLAAGAAAAAVVFPVRVVSVLWRFSRAPGRPGRGSGPVEPGGPGKPGQPSQPGRTRPDS
ncbi:DUF6332 family protein [Streptomyces sp. NPDC007861]|uniref:DUF6332 family protein n=1 Tax=Streptomyces sp. NPDC007861 TaxID=3154893 RepID=UPI0033C4EFC5